jgi:cytoskeleton protein RodZ
MTDTPAGGSGPSAGALLRAAREKQGLHIAALAASIKVAPRKLDALENDRWNELPDATFARALAQTVCRTLKIDARPVLDLLPPAEHANFESSLQALNAPFRERGDDGGLAGAAIKPLVVAAVLLMLAAVAVYFWPVLGGIGQPRSVGVVSTPLPLPAASAAGPAAMQAMPAPSPGAPAALSAEPGAPAPPAAGAAASAAAVVPAAPAAPPPVPVVRGETVFAAPAAASVPVIEGLLQIRVTADSSWIEVRDARGRSLLSRTVLPGEAVGLDGELPLRLVVGNATATQISFRGRPVEVVARGRENVARLELQ